MLRGTGPFLIIWTRDHNWGESPYACSSQHSRYSFPIRKHDFPLPVGVVIKPAHAPSHIMSTPMISCSKISKLPKSCQTSCSPCSLSFPSQPRTLPYNPCTLILLRRNTRRLQIICTRHEALQIHRKRLDKEASGTSPCGQPQVPSEPRAVPQRTTAWGSVFGAAPRGKAVSRPWYD
jgi:hypothetical protein